MRASFRISGLGAAALILASVLATTQARGGEAERGAVLYQQHCKRCHQVGSGAGNRIGPHLNDLFGRSAGALEGFRYSAAMRSAGRSGTVWTEAALDAFLANPRDAWPGTRMSFAGLPAPEDRAALLSWLRSVSGAGEELLQAEPTMTAAEYGLDPGFLSLEGDPEYGAYLASECVVCHQSDGMDRGIPSITGWPVDDFAIVMQAYKHGELANPVMRLIAGRLSDEEIAALAAYYQGIADGS